MSDLTRLRDWARRMAEGEKLRVPRPLDYGSAYSPGPKTITVITTPSERVLWRQIADEIDTFIEGDAPAPDDNQLEFGATTTNPPRDPATVLAAHDEGVSA